MQTAALTEAEREIRRVAAELTIELRRKLATADRDVHVDLWIGWERCVAFLYMGRGRLDRHERFPTLALAIEWARETITAIPDTDAYAWQFDPTDPRNQVAA